MKTIRITPTHVYLDDFDISTFVVGVEVESSERVTIKLLGDVVDERKPKPKARKARKKGEKP